MSTTSPEMFFKQDDFERITNIVSTEFQIEEAFLEHNIPTYHLDQSQETKKPFIRLLKKLEASDFTGLLRHSNGRLVLKIFPQPTIKKSNTLVNWLLFFVTLATTFATGFLLSENLLDPVLGGITFTITLMTVIGLHELGHIFAARKKGIDTTLPYFIPGPPPIGNFFMIGTFGAVILQRSLPPNKDAQFDIGAYGPIIGFLVSSIAMIIGLPLSLYNWVPMGAPTLPEPILFWLFSAFLLPPFATAPPSPGPGYMPVVILHPVAIAGWIGLILTMLQLFPTSMLDGGHVARSLFNEKFRTVLTVFSVVSLMVVSVPMAIFVILTAMRKQPGSLDDVSVLSKSRKLMAVVLALIFVLSSFLHHFIFFLLQLISI